MKLAELSEKLKLMNDLQYKKKQADNQLNSMRTPHPKEGGLMSSQLDISIQENVVKFLQDEINKLDEEV